MTTVNTQFYTVLFAFGAVLGSLVFTSCSSEQEDLAVEDNDLVKFSFSLSPFENETLTRTTVDGNSFDYNDKIRFKIICPNSTSHELGETWGSYYTINLPADFSDEVSYFSTGTYGSYESQATTYVYTAQNTTGTRIFVVGEIRYERPSNFFFADQSKLEQFKKSDVVWAQAVRQTGAREVHLNFTHKVAKLDITINDANGVFSDNTILTLEGMPDIDGAEIVVGDYYADESYESDYAYNYKSKASCSYENNGKVIGIEVIDENQKKSIVNALSGNPYPAGGASNNGSYATVANIGVYRAYQDPNNKKHYMLYVPPCDLDPNKTGDKNAEIWLRDGDKRYKIIFDQTEFKEGYCYTQTINIVND